MAQEKGEALKKDILVVEDSEIQALMLKRILLANGYNVIWAKNGAEGVNIACEKRPDMVISDVRMPVMDGYRMCSKIKSNRKLKNIPVLLLTQLAEPEDVIKGLQAGADSYITKPYSSDYLISKIEALFKKNVDFRNIPQEKCIKFTYGGKEYKVYSGRVQTLNFLLSTYENAIIQNKEMNRVQLELKVLNEQLEEKVRERTEDLTKEIAERRSAEAALRESEERFRTLVGSASDAVICIEPPGRIYLWNKKAEEMFGYTSAEALGKDLHALIVPERYHQKAYAGLKGFFEKGTGNIVGKTTELSALRRDGTEFPAEISLSAINVRGVWNTVGIIRDITIRKKLEEELTQKLDEMERMNKLMVGRELKMEELRSELRVLRAKVKEIESREAPLKA